MSRRRVPPDAGRLAWPESRKPDAGPLLAGDPAPECSRAQLSASGAAGSDGECSRESHRCAGWGQPQFPSARPRNGGLVGGRAVTVWLAWAKGRGCPLGSRAEGAGRVTAQPANCPEFRHPAEVTEGDPALRPARVLPSLRQSLRTGNPSLSGAKFPTVTSELSCMPQAPV